MTPSRTYKALAVEAFAIGVARYGFIGCLMLTAFSHANAQQPAADARHGIVGTWRLVFEIHISNQGIAASNAGFGADFQGVMIFTAGGDYSSLSARPKMPKYPTGQLPVGHATLEMAPESSIALQPSIASFGDYSVSSDGKILTVRIKGSTWASWVGVEQKRMLILTGDELKFTVPAWHIGGTTEFIYQRMR